MMQAIKSTLNMRNVTVIICAFASFLCSCTSDAPRITKINGTTMVQTDTRVCGIKAWTKEKEVKTKAQKLDDLDFEKAKAKQDEKLKTESRQKAAAFWFGIVCFIGAAACVVFGYVSQGWKFWGGMAGVSAALGAAAWSFEHLIPYLKWPAFGLAGVGVLWSMWKLKDFSAKKKLRALVNSVPGELFKKEEGTHKGMPVQPGGAE